GRRAGLRDEVPAARHRCRQAQGASRRRRHRPPRGDGLTRAPRSSGFSAAPVRLILLANREEVGWMKKIAATIAFSAICLLAAGLASPRARAETVDMLLVLAADVSRSIDEGEFNLQRKGYAAALTDPRVIRAIVSGRNHAIALTFIEWSGASDQ